MHDIIFQLQKRKEDLTGFRTDAVNRLRKLKYNGNPKYHLCVDSKKSQCYLKKDDSPGKGKYLPANKHAIAEQIATYEYLNKIIKMIDREIKHIDVLLNSYSTVLPEDYYETLSIGRQKLIVPIRLTDDQLVESWMSQPYVGGRFEEGEAEFYTDKNERVRSKSEILIANALNKHNVPYKYECPIVLKGLGKIYTDFTALNVKRRKIFYWEHLGMLDDADYSRKNVFRINTYEKNGIYHGENLITTWETSTLPLDVKLVDQIIRHYLLD